MLAGLLYAGSGVGLGLWLAVRGLIWPAAERPRFAPGDYKWLAGEGEHQKRGADYATRNDRAGGAPVTAQPRLEPGGVVCLARAVLAVSVYLHPVLLLA